MTDDNRMAWSGTCEACMAIYVVYAGYEASPEQSEAISTQWPESHVECLREDCEGTIEWNGNDPVSAVLTARML